MNEYKMWLNTQWTFTATKKNSMISLLGKWMELEIVVLNERQAQNMHDVFADLLGLGERKA